MQGNFDRCVHFVLPFEGGYSDHPSDPGGATNLGITRAVLEDWRGRTVTKADVKALTLEEASDIYRARYWDRIRGDELPSGVDLIVFDCAVNQGVPRAIRLLQQALNVEADGHIGPKTMSALRSVNIDALIDEFAARRMAAYANLVTLFRVFGLGWSRRLMAIHNTAISEAI